MGLLALTHAILRLADPSPIESAPKWPNLVESRMLSVLLGGVQGEYQADRNVPVVIIR